MTNQLITQQQSSIDKWGSQADLQAFSERLLQTYLPGGKKLAPQEALALAQVANVLGLNPFIGEVWYIPGVGPFVGIKGLRTKAAEQDDAKNASHWVEFKQVDAGKYGEGANAVVYECYLRDSFTQHAWTQAVHQLTSSGAGWSEAKELLGPPPVFVGVGIATPNEQSRMKIHARAQKRAESDAIKHRYNIPLAGAQVSDFDEAGYDEPSPITFHPGTQVVDATSTEVQAPALQQAPQRRDAAPKPPKVTVQTPEAQVQATARVIDFSAMTPDVIEEQAKVLAELKTPKGMRFGDMDREQLTLVSEKSTTPELKDAAYFLLNMPAVGTLWGEWFELIDAATQAGVDVPPIDENSMTAIALKEVIQSLRAQVQAAPDVSPE